MSYETSLALAWQEMQRLGCLDGAVRFLGQMYLVSSADRRIALDPGAALPDGEMASAAGAGIAAGQMEAVLILHYLTGLAGKGYQPTGEWISFKEAPGGESFWPALVESCIKPLQSRFESDPQGLIRSLESRMPTRRIEGGDVALEMEVLAGIFIRMLFWMRDDELPAGVVLLFDRALLGIYCTEDVAVLLMAAAEETSGKAEL